MTGFFRDGFCNTNSMDQGTHVVCAVLTAEFLAFTKARGNDLSTPHPEFQGNLLDRTNDLELFPMIFHSEITA